MKSMRFLSVITGALLLLTACGAQEAPLDSNGKNPQQVMMETYTAIIEGRFADAEINFSKEFRDEFVAGKNKTFEDYAKEFTPGWKVAWLKTIMVGNDYNDNVWRVKIIPDEGKGAGNGPGIVQDLYIIEGRWQIVFWGHYVKS